MTKTLFVYTTSNGTTEKVAKMISDHLAGEIHLVNLKKTSAPDVNLYDQVIIGGSIYAGKVNRRLRRFCNDNQEKLSEMSIALFICCLDKPPKREEHFNNAFPDVLKKHALANGMFSGELNPENMNFIMKFFVKIMIANEPSDYTIDRNEIIKFAEEFQKRSTC